MKTALVALVALEAAAAFHPPSMLGFNSKPRLRHAQKTDIQMHAGLNIFGEISDN
jgi:hypothetical protein